MPTAHPSEPSHHHYLYYYHLAECPFGWLALIAGPQGLRRISLQPTRQQALAGLGSNLQTAAASAAPLAHALAACNAYFAGDPTVLTRIPLDLGQPPPFYRAAWDACRTIPPGETRSYQWLAQAAGNPRAARAAGQAMAKNPLPLVIPCHRVIGTAGALHGYGAGGLQVKARLLELERRLRPPML